jgi:trehalose-phosphatase
MDYDGTLTPIVERPELAELPARARAALAGLARERRVKLGFVSGRALPDLRVRVGIPGAIYAGNHGLEMEGPGLAFVSPLAEEMRGALRLMRQVLTRALAAIPGVVVEDKGLTFSVHYRQAETRDEGAVQATLDRVTAGARALGRVKVTRGKKVFEVRPAVDWDKGRAIRLLAEKHGQGGAVIFMGDDLTDEDGFRALAKRPRSLAIHVGGPGDVSAARYRLGSTEEVADFLELLLGLARRGFH